MGFLLNHISERGIEIYINFHFASTTPSTEEGKKPFPGEYRSNYASVIGEFDAYFTSTNREPPVNVERKTWLHLKRAP